MNKLLIIPSVLFFLLGIVGLIIPVVPQIPFFAISILFLASASKKFKKYIISSELYREHLKKYIDRNDKLSNFMNDV